jgi:hypothetical protein
MQFQLPQFIETEDKIIGPFTLKQFLYVAATGGTGALLFFILNPVIWFVVCAPIIALGIAFGFMKINGQPFPKIAAAALQYYWRPQIYIWQPEHTPAPKLETLLSSSPHPEQSPALSLEKIVAGIALKSAWQGVETGSRPAAPLGEVAKKSFAQMRERYEVFRRLTGDRHAAKRVDYR